MSKKQAQNRPFQLSDYNEPTEPLDVSALPSYPGPFSPPPEAFSVAPTVQAPQPYPQQPQAMYPYYQQPQAVYPVLPPSPIKKNRGQPPGGASSPYSAPAPARRWRRSPLPGLVRFCFILVQLVLVIRVVCMLFDVQGTAPWFALLLATGDLLVQPISWVAANINLSLLAGTPILPYLEFLVAILAYGLFSRLLTLLLRVLLN